MQRRRSCGAPFPRPPLPPLRGRRQQRRPQRKQLQLHARCVIVAARGGTRFCRWLGNLGETALDAKPLEPSEVYIHFVPPTRGRLEGLALSAHRIQLRVHIGHLADEVGIVDIRREEPTERDEVFRLEERHGSLRDDDQYTVRWSATRSQVADRGASRRGGLDIFRNRNGNQSEGRAFRRFFLGLCVRDRKPTYTCEVLRILGERRARETQGNRTWRP